MSDHNISDLMTKLLEIDLYEFSSLNYNICKSLVDNIYGVKFCSLLTYNKDTEEIIYNCICLSKNNKSKENDVKQSIENNIFLKKDDSVSGEFVKSKKNVLIIPDVNKLENYKSKKLSELLSLKKGVFLKVKNSKNDDKTYIIIFYPNELYDDLNITEYELEIICKIIENIISNAKRIREKSLLDSILSSAISLNVDLQSFLHKLFI